MRNFLILLIAATLLFGAGGVSNAVVIEIISFDGCMSELCTSQISVTANDPAGGNLSYAWMVLNGDDSMIIGSGADVVFDPPDSGPHPCPYQIQVVVTSDASGLSEYQTLDMCLRIAGDVNGDDVVNVIDKVAVRNCFGKPGVDECKEADLNCDGVVNVLDKVIVRNHFGEKGECQDSYFFDNFECGAGKWTLSGQDWGLTETSVHGGDLSITDSPGGDYPNYADEIVKMKSSIDLSSATFPVLTFWGKCLSGVSNSDDHIYVDVSVDGGFTWHEVWHKQDLNQSTWKQEGPIDLSPYISSHFKIRFRLASDSQGTADGWYIDDIEIREFDAVPTPPYPFFDDFESGTGNWIISGQGWALTEDSYVSSTHSLTDSPDGSYPNYSHAVAESEGLMDLSSATFPVLTFWGKCLSGVSNSDDHIYVDVSDDGGFTWHEVWHKQDLNQSTWKQEGPIDLRPYISSHFKIRFRLASDSQGTADGWYIDDIEIREFDAVPTPPYPFFDDFEGGTGNWIISGQGWALTEDSYVSSTHSLTDSPDGSYPNYSHAVAESEGLMDLSSATFPVLTFWGKCLSGVSNSDDHIYVDVSDDGGFTWHEVWHKQDLNQSTWKQEGPIDLRPYISSHFKIRFRLASDSQGTADGWYIDDVNIAEFE